MEGLYGMLVSLSSDVGSLTNEPKEGKRRKERMEMRISKIVEVLGKGRFQNTH
jgi:hypothetical protein